MKMNIQKSRMAALIGLMLMVCMMVSMMVLPASAAMIEKEVYITGFGFDSEYAEMIHSLVCDCESFSFNSEEIIETVIITDSNFCFYVDDIIIEQFFEPCDCDLLWLDELVAWEDEDGFIYYATNVSCYDLLEGYLGERFSVITREVEGFGISDVVTPSLFNTVLDEIVALLPIVIPVMIGFIGLRKGISFLQSVLHSA